MGAAPNDYYLPKGEFMTTEDLMKLADKFAFFMPGSEEGEKARQALLDALQSQAERIKELEAKMVPLEKDAARYRWLRERYTAVNFDWEESGQQAVIFTADDFPIASASCDETIDAAMGITGEPK